MIELIDRVETMSSNADILLVTAAEVESRAVLEVAEEFTGHPSSSLEVGTGTYRDLGTVNGKKVWLVQSEMGAGGPGGAHETVGHAILEVKPEEVIMVGIAFGSNREKHKIGDVLVAKQLHMYEPQRRGTDRAIPRGDKASASPRLLQRFDENAGRMLSRGPSVGSFWLPAQECQAGLADGQRPLRTGVVGRKAD